MDYSYDNETRMLDDSIVRFVADNTGAKQDLWPQMAELGWLSLPFTEEAGGAGFGGIGSMVLMERFGAGLISTPYIPSVAMTGHVLAQSGNQADCLAALIEGRSRPAIAGLWGQDVAQIMARADGDNFILNGSAILVPGSGDGSGNGDVDVVVVAACVAGSSETALFLVAYGLEGVSFTPCALFDGRQTRRITLSDVAVPATQRLDTSGKGNVALRAMWDAGLLAAAAETIGAMQTLFDLTLDYAKTRKQFGRAIGSFQTLQFRLVDAWIKLDEARSLVMTATMASNDGHDDAHKLTIASWIQTMWSAKAIAEEAIQIHGAIAMTEEYDVSRYTKRILLNELVFGSAARHLEYYRSLTAA